MSAPVLVVGELGPLEHAYLVGSPKHTLLGEVSEAAALRAQLRAAVLPLNLVVLAHEALVEAVRDEDPALFRRSVARLFLVGGQAAPFLPIDPRLQERYPERYVLPPCPARGRLLVSGEAVIWLPGDVCLWRYWDEPGQQAHFLSVLPALCLAALPEPLPWLRLFRTLPARAAVGADGSLVALTPNDPSPNLYVVAAVDGASLSRFLVANTVS